MQTRLIPLTILVVVSGCSRGTESSVEVRHDPERARTALITALDAWKRGEAGKLARGNPAIRFVDEDFVAGRQLSGYELEEPDTPILPHQNVPVLLSMRDKRGKLIRRETHYQVSTDPMLAVLRSDK
jgi:hypothetical protein